MPMRDLWHSTLVYFGVREEDWVDDEYDDDGAAANEDLERTYSERPNVRRLKPRRGRGGADYDDIFSDDEPRAVSARRRPPDAPAQNGHRSAQQVSLVVPKSFNDAQTVADKLQFKSELRFAPLFWLTIKNWLLMIVTLGLYWPFAKVAFARMHLEAVSVATRLNIDELHEQLRLADGDAAGDAAGDLFGVDIGL